MPRNLEAVLLSATLLAAGGTAPAQSPKGEAKRHFDAGLTLVESEDFEAAAAEFEASIALYATKMGLFNLANCYKALRRYGEAIDTVDRLEREFEGKLGTLEADVAKLKAEMSGIVASVEIRVVQPGASVLVDGREAGKSPLPRPLVLGPGEHVLEVTLDGFEAASRRIKLASADAKTEAFDLVPAKEEQPPAPAVIEKAEEPEQVAPEPAPAPIPAAQEKSSDKNRLWPVFWSGLAGTVVAGALTGVFYGLASGKSDDFDGYRNEYQDTTAALALDLDNAELRAREAALWAKMAEASDDTETYSNLGLVFCIAAGVLAAATSVVGVVAMRADERPSVEVSAAPGGLAVSY